MGGGLCWLDYDDDGWLDLYVVNAYADDEYDRWAANGGLPRSALFHNVDGRFEDVSRGSGADLQLRGNGCVAADFNLDGHTDLFVTTAGYNVATNGYDALLWGHGDGTFTEGARAAGINTPGWHSGAAVGDVNGDGRPDLFVAGYADVNTPIPASSAGFPSNFAAVRDRLYLNDGVDGNGRSRFREVGRQAGIEAARVDHGLGAVFTDVDDDGRLDLYVANDLDPNRLYLNVARPRRARLPLRRARTQRGRRRPERGHGHRRRRLQPRRARRPVRDQLARAAARRLPQHRRRRSRTPGPTSSPALGTNYTGWGVVVGRPRPRRQSRPRPRERRDPAPAPGEGRRADPGAREPDRRGTPRRVRRRRRGGRRCPPAALNGRGLAAADYDNDGDMDVAVNSIGGPLLLLRNSGATRSLARGEAERASRPARRSRPCCRAGGGSCARSTPAAATSRPRIRASTSASAPRRGSPSSSCAPRTAAKRRLTNVAADQAWSP